ncbi:MAG: type IV secretory system conjugative DNA transfer family protein [Lachnospiraceae bacterium]|nr:type IV secretory system conjugative DNA transfer family protein [Lachnospiraceae bacterium]
MEPKKKTGTGLIMIIMAFAFVLLMSLHLASSHEAAKALAPDGGKAGLGAVLSELTRRTENEPFNIEFNESSPLFAGTGLGILAMALVYYYASRGKYIRGKEHGTARWGSKADIKNLFASSIAGRLKRGAILRHGISIPRKMEEIRKIKEKYKDADMILTATERASIHNYEINNNTLVIGGSGSGKTRSYVMPNLLQAHSSYVITDPKGEILEKSGHFLEMAGYKIRVLNLDQLEGSCGYNPFNYIHMERHGWEARILTLIETIIINTKGENAGAAADPFWETAERLFLQSIFFFTAQGFPDDERNFNTVMELISWLELPEDEDLRDSDLDYFCEAFAEKYGESHIGVQQYNEFRSKSSGKTAKSIVISAVARLAPFRVSEVKRIFSYDQMSLDRIGEEKTAVFVIVPPTDKTFNFIAGILFTQLFQEIQHCALIKNKHNGQRLPVPVRFILDEFANTCRIPQFIEILAYARSLGVGITTILQSLDQIKKIYEKDWGVIIDNSNTLLYLGAVTHMDTLEYLSKLLGAGTYDKKSFSMQRTGRGGSSQTLDNLKRELLLPDEIRRMSRRKCLLVVGGTAPFYSSKYRYERHKNYRHTSDGNKKNTYHFEPPQPGLPKREAGSFLDNGGDISPGADELFGGPGGPIELDNSPRALASAIKTAIESPESISLSHGEEGDVQEEAIFESGEVPEDFDDILAGIDLEALAP